MFPFVYVLVFIINDCFQTLLCRLIRLGLYQFWKCTTRLLVWTGFQRWVPSCIANSHEILPVLATTVLSKEIQLFLTTFFQPIACRELVCFFWEGTITVLKAKSSVQACLLSLWSSVTELQAPSLVFHVCSLSGLQLLCYL